jgi:hypothetical protein
MQIQPVPGNASRFFFSWYSDLVLGLFKRPSLSERAGQHGTVTIMNDKTGRKMSEAYFMAISRHFFGRDSSYHERVQPEQNVSGRDYNPRPVTCANNRTTPLRSWCYYTYEILNALIILLYIGHKVQQKLLGRTNRLLSFETTRTAQKTKKLGGGHRHKTARWSLLTEIGGGGGDG